MHTQHNARIVAAQSSGVAAETPALQLSMIWSKDSGGLVAFVELNNYWTVMVDSSLSNVSHRG